MWDIPWLCRVGLSDAKILSATYCNLDRRSNHNDRAERLFRLSASSEIVDRWSRILPCTLLYTLYQ